MAKLPPLARSVMVGSTAYRAGDTPPLDHAAKITNPLNWEGGKVPNFDNGEDGDHTANGITNSDAANAQRTGLPGFGTDSQPRQIVRPDTDGEGAGSGDDDGQGAGDSQGQGDGQGDGEGAGDGNTTPPKPAGTTRARKATTQG